MLTKSEILSFIKSKPLMTISTIDLNAAPQSALVGFGQTDDFQIIFGTSNTSRKYANIGADPRVAIVIGWDSTQTIQYEGEARELQGEEAVAMSEIYFVKHIEARKYRDLADQRYFLVEPTWLRYTDLAHTPWEIVEITF